MPALMAIILWGCQVNRLTADKLQDILADFGKRRVIVIGDIMLDEYLWGKVQRISPEAPVPVIELNHEEYRLGGAANVALNLAALGAKVELIGVYGQDSHAGTINGLLGQHGISTNGLFVDKSRPTTLKTRIGAVSQQIVRLDREDTSDIGIEIRDDIAAYLEELMPECDAMIIEDYDKGLLCRELIEKAIGLAAQHNVPVAVDPKQKHFDMYRNVDVFKPNYAELQAYLGKNYSDKNGFLAAASELRQDINCKHLVVTWGSKGMYVFSEDAQPQHFPSFAREVFDVSGAGDTVISALCLAYLKEQDVFTAALVANHAAAVVVAKHGTASVNTLEIMDSFYEQSN